MISFQVSSDMTVAQLAVETDAREHPRIAEEKLENQIVEQSELHTQLVPRLVVRPTFA